MLYLKNLKKGSTSVEAALLVPVIIVSIIAVIYIGLILCERCSMQAAADYASEAGSAVWKHTSADIETGKIYISSINDDALYWRISDVQKNAKNKKNQNTVNSYKYSQIAVETENREAASNVKDFLIYKKLEVELEQCYQVPIPGFLGIFGIDNVLGMQVKSVSVVNEPAELIRNIDFVADVENELEKKYPAVKNLGEKTRNIFKQINDKIKDFCD